MGMEDHYGRSKDEEDLCKNGTKVAEWKTKGAACASVSRHFGATRNWTQLAEKSCYWQWVMDLQVQSTHQTAEPWMSPRPKKARVFKSKTKALLIAFFDVHGTVHAEFLPQGQTINQHLYKNILRGLMRSVREKRRDCGKRGHGCFIMTMFQPGPARRGVQGVHRTRA